MGQDAAFEEGVDLVLDESRQAGAGLGLRDVGRGALLHPAVQRGLFRTVALAVNMHAIGHTPGPPADGLRDALPKW
jgi:hypothetical protein